MALMGFFVNGGAGTATSPTASWTDTSPVATPAYEVTLTGYNAVPEQTDSTPDITASGTFSNPEIIAARSVDLADDLPFGTVIALSYDATSSPKCGFDIVHDIIGLRVIGDSMHARKHDQIDIMFDAADTVTIGGKQTNPAIALGICKNIQVHVVGHIDPKHMPKDQLELETAIGKSVVAVK
jgi:3D (Asp-Asp-Asp) domain-containing protein